MKKNILFIESSGLNKNALSEIKKKFKTKINMKTCLDNELSIYNALTKIDIHAIIGCPRYLFTKKILTKAKKLEWVHNSGAGVEGFFFNEFVNSNILFTNGKIIQGPEVADHAVALILSFTRNLNLIINNKEKYDGKKNVRPIELRNKKCLIFGFGGIGICVAERLKAFGMQIHVISDDLPPLLSFIDNFYPTDELFNLISRFDVVVCAAPSTIKTVNIFNKKIFNKMKKDSIFINVSRGNLVNTNDLLDSVKINKFKGVGLDVTHPEPLSINHPLRNFDNVIITPHLAGLSDNNRARSFDLILLNIKKYIENNKLFNIVDKNYQY